MTHLVIVESPAKCQKIQGFLGKGWRVIASLGHIRGLEENLDFLTHDYEPRYTYLKEKANAIKQLKEAAAAAEDIYLAADKDFEGEQIAYSVAILLKLDVLTVKRITFTEITENAICYAINHPGIIDMNRVHTQQARALMDLLIGFTISPLLWRNVAPALSAGRCQIPAVRLVVEREDLIAAFKAESSFQLHVHWTHSSLTFLGTMTDELEDEESALNYMEHYSGVPKGTIQSIEVKPWWESAPLPLMTSTLQQQASARFGMNPKEVMRAAQRLYEQGHITYMRTDKAVLSEEAIVMVTEWVKENYGEAYVQPEKKKELKRSKKEEKEEKKEKGSAQEAHEAIRPTHINHTSVDGDYAEKRIYQLIWQRTIQSVMSPVQGEICRIMIQLEGDMEFSWGSQWKRIIFEGWRKAGLVHSLDDEKEEVMMDDVWPSLGMMKVDDSITWSIMMAEPKETHAKGRFMEATLIRELETFGIGRPSTFASLLSTIQEKNYVESIIVPARQITIQEYHIQPYQWPVTVNKKIKKIAAEKNRLIPTALGRSVLAFCVQHFDDLFSCGFTSVIEKQLDGVAEGHVKGRDVIHGLWTSYQARYEQLAASPLSQSSSPKIKTFSDGLKAVQTKKGPLLLCEQKDMDTQFFGWPPLLSFEEMTEEVARIHVMEYTIVIGTYQDYPLQKKSGKFGPYIEWNTVHIPWIEVEMIEETIARLIAKQTVVIREFKHFIIREGKFSPYVMKIGLKKPQFVTIPKGIDITTLTEKDVEGIYRLGSKGKKESIEREKTEKKEKEKKELKPKKNKSNP